MNAITNKRIVSTSTQHILLGIPFVISLYTKPVCLKYDTAFGMAASPQVGVKHTTFTTPAAKKYNSVGSGYTLGTLYSMYECTGACHVHYVHTPISRIGVPTNLGEGRGVMLKLQGAAGQSGL